MNQSDAAKQVVRVTIFNQTYSVSTSGDPEQTQQLAQEIDELMSAIARRAGNLDTARTAVLACLHMADRLRTAELELSVLKESIHDKSRSLASLLDEACSFSEAEDQPVEP